MPESRDNVQRFFDVERAVEEWGRVMFERNARTRKQKRLRKKHFVDHIDCIDVQIDWSHLSTSHRTQWGQIRDEDFTQGADSRPNGVTDGARTGATTSRAADVENAEVNVLFQTDFSNDTDETQQYTLKIEKTTNSTCTTEIENGVTHGVELSASLNICDVMEIGAGFSREVSLSKMEGETISNEVTWGAESTIVVPKGKSASAEMQVLEKKQSGDFTVFTTMAGYVIIKYIDMKDNSTIFRQSGKIKLIVDEYVKEVGTTGKKFRGVNFGNDGSVTFQTIGKCAFRFGVKQLVKVVQRPRSPRQ